MTKTLDSLPWSQSEATYTDDQWSDTWRKLFMTDRTVQGVIKGYENELAVSNPSGTTIRVATGAGMVDGKFCENDANYDFSVTVPGSGSNYYTIVLQKDWSDEDVYLEMLGPDVAAPPTVTQTDGTLWEVSIATVQVTSASAITITDARVWIEASSYAERTRKFLVPVKIGYNHTDTVDLEPTAAWLFSASTSNLAFQLPVNKECTVFSEPFVIPFDYVSGLSITALVYPQPGQATNDVYVDIHFYGQETYPNVANDSEGSEGFIQEEILETPIGPYELTELSTTVGSSPIEEVSAGMVCKAWFRRDGDHASDTYGGYIEIAGFIVEYTADS